MPRVFACAALLGLISIPTFAAEPTPGKFPPVTELPSIKELPDPFTFFNGKKVETKEDWVSKRRPELKELFQHYMYGYFPAAPEKIEVEVVRVEPEYFGGKATKKEVLISFGPKDCPKISLLVVTPNKRTGPAPVFVGVNFNGNHTLLADPNIAIPTSWMRSGPGVVDNKATAEGRGKDVNVWALEQTIDRGYAVATFYTGDIDPDRPDFTDGVHPHFFKAGQTAPAQHDWGTIAAWAWGIQRAVDFLVTDKDLDKDRIAVVGHSRNGKTALVAAAFDDRIALAIPHQAGCGGTAPSRGTVGESVKRINDVFPHWFCDEFVKFNEQVDKLPIDQHELVALVAPRPILFTNAVEDQWANPNGQFEVLQAADKVYRFLGAEGLGAEKMPEPGKLISSNLGYFIREGKHSMTAADWQVYMDFADKHLKKKG